MTREELMNATNSTDLETLETALDLAFELVKAAAWMLSVSPEMLTYREETFIVGRTWAEYRVVPRVGTKTRIDEDTRFALFVASNTRRAYNAIVEAN